MAETSSEGIEQNASSLTNNNVANMEADAGKMQPLTLQVRDLGKDFLC